MTAEMQLIRLVHQADWTRLSLAAEVNDGSRLLLAPGRRYRVQTPDGAYGCDGERPWRLPKPDEDRSGRWIEGPKPPLPVLLCPAWLLRNSLLDDPAPEISPDGRPTGPEVSDEVLQFLHDSGTAAFDATLHEWFDLSAMLAPVPESARQAGFGGLGLLLDALTERWGRGRRPGLRAPHRRARPVSGRPPLRRQARREDPRV
jgi:hypothetical protein